MAIPVSPAQEKVLWFVIDGGTSGSDVLRGPYSHPNEAAAVRAEMERNGDERKLMAVGRAMPGVGSTRTVSPESLEDRVRDDIWKVTEEMTACAQDPRYPVPLAALLSYWASAINQAVASNPKSINSEQGVSHG